MYCTSMHKCHLAVHYLKLLSYNSSTDARATQVYGILEVCASVCIHHADATAAALAKEISRLPRELRFVLSTLTSSTTVHHTQLYGSKQTKLCHLRSYEAFGDFDNTAFLRVL